jgi:plasmid stabilization system protein ParE
VKFETSKRARRHIEMINRWWHENRSEAVTLFLDELEEAERRLLANPDVGVLYAKHRSGGVRRWGGPRGHAPKL